MAEFGALSSLGVGSGVLTYDVIDKLRKADEKTIIEPIDKRIEKMEKQEEELNTLVTKTAALKSSILDLSDSVFLAKRTVDISGDDIDITAEDGVPVQEIDITVNQLAKANIDQSKGFATKETIVTTSDTTMTISIDGSDFTLDVAAGTTLEELMQLINDETNGKVTASIFNTGGTDPYSLIIKSAETGAAQTIGYSFGGGDFLSMTNVQAPQDAEFVFNGISITRSSNLVDDLVYGMTLTLKQADPSASNHVSIKQDNEAIAESVQAFVDAYNDFMTEITTATKYNKETKTVGIFQGEGTINGLKYGVNNIVLGMTPDGGLPDIGITVDR
ncbi:flagellar filament capping protein FliD, partial [Hydrogenimonas sp.]|uniref:flagellar filament capping protein FliD n=1 Tax=Hydrogenimonas sp. TaxID=2231112 RepID=UPI002620D50A